MAVFPARAGRKRLAEEYCEETSEEECGEEGTWLVMYNFGSKPNPRFARARVEEEVQDRGGLQGRGRGGASADYPLG